MTATSASPAHHREALEAVRDQAANAGLMGPAVATAQPPPGASRAMGEWLAAGHHGEMGYMSRPGRADPTAWAPWSRSVALFAQTYAFADEPSTTDPSRGLISRYARGDDYHVVLKGKLSSMVELLVSRGFAALAFVDTSPLMEKAMAAAAGLGWLGKNGNLIRAEEGSYFFLGGVVTDAVWAPSPPQEDQCGTCDMCIPACPTGAIISPGVIDARRCISYLTIELKGAIPRHLRPLVGNRVFGCDDCQEICPWNRFTSPTPDDAYRARRGLLGPQLIELALLTEEEFRSRFRGSAVRRCRWRGFLRNVMVALGNWGDTRALPALRHGLAHPDSLVRGHAAWALGRLPGAAARSLLRSQREDEPDLEVQGEIREALEDSTRHAADRH